MSTFERIGREYLAQIVAFLVALAERLLVPAVFLRLLGVEDFAIWSVALAVAAYVPVLEFGTTRYFTNRLIRLQERGEKAEAVREFRAGQTVVGGLALVAGVVAMATVVVASSIAIPVTAALVASAVVMQLVAIRRALYRAQREYARETWLGQAALVGRVGGTLAAALAGYELVWVALAWLVSTVAFTLLPFWIDSRRRYSSFEDLPGWPDRRDRQHMFIAAPGLWLQMLGTTLIQTAPILAINALAAGAFAVAQFVLLRTLANFVRQILQMFSNLFSLELARRHATGDEAGFAAVFMESNRFLAVQTAVASVALMLLAEPLFILWTGDAALFDLALLGLAILPPLVLPSTMGAIEAFAYANRPWPVVAGRFFQLAIAVAVFLVLSDLPIVMRAMLALALGEIAGLGGMVLARLSSLNPALGPAHLLRLWWPSLLAGAIAAACILPVRLLRVESMWFELALGLAAACTALALAVWSIGLAPSRRAQILAFVRRG